MNLLSGLFGSRIITTTSKGRLGGRCDNRNVKESGRGKPGPEPEIPKGIPIDWV